jgi:hypothetical protein
VGATFQTVKLDEAERVLLCTNALAYRPEESAMIKKFYSIDTLNVLGTTHRDRPWADSTKFSTIVL